MVRMLLIRVERLHSLGLWLWLLLADSIRLLHLLLLGQGLEQKACDMVDIGMGEVLGRLASQISWKHCQN